MTGRRRGWRLFDRAVGTEFKLLAKAVAELSKSDSPADRMIAANLIADHRVRDEAARRLLSFFLERTGEPPGRAVLNSLRTYRKLTGTSPSETYLHSGNADNRRKPSDISLTHAWNATRFLSFLSQRPFLSAMDGEMRRLWADLGLPLRPMLLDDANGPLQTIVSSQDGFTGLLQLRSAWVSAMPFEPAWAAAEQDLASWMKRGEPNSWYFPLGLSLGTKERIYAVLFRYSSTIAGPLLRPTCLDAGDNPLHCPSPPSLPVDEGGVTMPLTRGHHLRRKRIHEFIHSHVELTTKNVLSHGWVKGPRDEVPPALARLRHVASLRQTCPKSDTPFLKNLIANIA